LLHFNTDKEHSIHTTNDSRSSTSSTSHPSWIWKPDTGSSYWHLSQGRQRVVVVQSLSTKPLWPLRSTELPWSAVFIFRTAVPVPFQNPDLRFDYRSTEPMRYTLEVQLLGRIQPLERFQTEFRPKTISTESTWHFSYPIGLGGGAWNLDTETKVYEKTKDSTDVQQNIVYWITEQTKIL